MLAILFLFVVSMIPVLGVWLCIQLFRWLMKRHTGAEVQITPNNYFDVFRNIKTVWHHDPLNYEVEGQRKERKPKHNPHYDRLIEQENNKRLEGARDRISDTHDTEEQEAVPLASLLKDDNISNHI